MNDEEVLKARVEELIENLDCSLWAEVIRCAYSSSLKILKAFLHFRLWSGGRLFTLSDASARIAI